MKNLGKLLAHPGAKSILFILIILLVIWIFGPLFSFNGVKPFSSMGARFTLSGIVIVVALLKVLLDLVLKYKKELWGKIKEGFKKVSQASHARFSMVKGRLQEDKTERQLRRLPWYLVVGPRTSGKTTLIQQSGLRLKPRTQLTKEALRYLEQFPSYDWWFTDEAVFIDITEQNPVVREESDNENSEQQKTWQRFLKVLHKKRGKKPISGVLFTYSLTDLFLKESKVRQAEIYSIFFQLRQIHAICKVQLPIYTVLTKCDLVEGFVEFFHDLSKEELEQVWGVTHPIDESMEMNQVLGAFHREYPLLMESLSQKTLWKMDSEKNAEKRERMYGFSQQMRLFNKNIANLIAEIFGAVRSPHAIQCRGFYFTSGAQVGKPHDFLTTVFRNKYQVSAADARGDTKSHQEAYFIDALFNNVLKKDSYVLGYSQSFNTFKQRAYQTAMVGIPVLALTSVVLAGVSYHLNTQNIKQLNALLMDHQRNVSALDLNDHDITKTLPVLNSLKAMQDLYKGDDASWITGFLPTEHRTVDAIDDALTRSINMLMLPRVAVALETNLRQSSKDTNLLYSMLEGYLAFSPSHPTAPDSLMGPMVYLWSQEDGNIPAAQQQLAFYLRDAVREGTIEKLPLDRTLIDDTRDKLTQVLPEHRAYELLALKSNTRDVTGINFMVDDSPTFGQVFTAKNPHLSLPALYTAAGFEKIFKPQFSTIATQVAHDNKAIGLGTRASSPQQKAALTRQLEQNYSQDYVAAWQGYLQNFNVVPFNNLQTAIQTLTLLTSDQSPMVDVLNAVAANTPLKTGQITIADDFASLNQYAATHQKPSKAMAPINKALVGIESELTNIANAPDPNKAAFEAAKVYMSGQSKDPIAQLLLAAKTAPEPLKTWLTTIANQSWSLVQQGALAYINAAWGNQVMSTYDDQLKNRYPFDPKASAQASVDAFSNLFAPSGVMDQFFNTYLSAFMDTTQPTWRLYQVQGQGLSLSPNTVALFQHAAQIRKMYFPDGNKTPQLQFAIQPNTLDANARSITLTLAGVTMTYSHGPQQPQTITWPVDIAEESVQATMASFNGSNSVAQFYGPWALFQLFDAGQVRQTNTANQYRFDVNLGGYTSSFLILTTDDLAVFRLDGVKGYTLPEQLS